MGFTIKCTTMGFTIKCPTMKFSNKCFAMEFTIKYSAMGNNTKCPTMGYITKYATMRNTSKWSTMGCIIKWSNLELLQLLFSKRTCPNRRWFGVINIWNRLQADAAACLQLLRMSLSTIWTLCDKLQTSYGLRSIVNVSIEESVEMFLRIYDHNEVKRDVGLRFGRTQETVKRKFFEVLTATELLACDYIKTPTRQELFRIPERLQLNQRYLPYFRGFVGAMDGW